MSVEEGESSSDSPEVITSQAIQCGSLNVCKARADPISQKSVSPHQNASELGGAASTRLNRVLASWHRDLGISGKGTCHFAFHLFKKAIAKMRMGEMPVGRLRVILSSCLLIASKFEELQSAVKKASNFAQVARVETDILLRTEHEVLSLLNWQPLDGYPKYLSNNDKES